MPTQKQKQAQPDTAIETAAITDPHKEDLFVTTGSDTGAEASADTIETTDVPEVETGHPDLMKELGLDKRYKTPEDALRAMSEKDRYIEQQRAEFQRISALNEQLARAFNEKTKPPEPSQEEWSEEFGRDPVAAMEKAGFVRAEKLQPLTNEVQNTRQRLFFQEVASAVSAHEDLTDISHYIASGQEPPRGINATWDRMTELQTTMGVTGRDPKVTIDLLHRLATQDETKPQRVGPREKTSATTSSRGRNPGKEEIPDFSKMSADEQYDWFKERGLVT